MAGDRTADKDSSGDEVQRLRQRVRELELAVTNASQDLYGDELYRRILSASQDCVKVLNLDGSLALMSENGQQVTEIDDIGPLIGRPWETMWPEAYHPVLRDAVTKAGHGQVVRFSGFCPTAKGTPKWWDVSVSPVMSRLGAPECLLAVSRDITERVVAEKALDALNRVLNARDAHSGTTTETRTAAANQNESSEPKLERAARLVAQEALLQAQKMDVLGRLTAGIAHDFNNILASVCGGLEIIRLRAGDDERLLRPADLAFRAAERGTALIRRMMAFSRSSDDLMEIELATAVNELQGILDHAMAAHHAVDVDLAPTCWVRINASQFDNALLNLCINARDAMPDGGNVTVETRDVHLDAADLEDQPERKPGLYALLTVGDTGVGMAPETIESIFEPFYTTKPLGKGTGLGLAQVYAFVSGAGGFIRVESNVGHGSKFCLYLPAAEQPAPEA
ncbi:MAG TPA: ATP-binding protein [Stellaceae bacterium]|jgi:PAS domain S-box-containing protein|nr:ATP-binding protein [Stellaceae bacterium]